MCDNDLLDIKSDYIFKQIFGAEKHKRLLLSLLNAILKGDPHIKSIELRNSEIAKILKDNKHVHLDVKAEVGELEYINIEIQTRNTGEIIDRAIQNLCHMEVEYAKLPNTQKADEEKTVSELLIDEKRRSYHYPKSIGIWIMGQNVSERSGPVHEICMSYQPNQFNGFELASKKIRILLIELPKFQPKTIDKKNMLEVWLKFLNNPLDEQIQDIDEVHEALDALRYVSADEDVRAIYNLRRETEFGYVSELTVKTEKAREEGEKIGIEKEKIKMVKMVKGLLQAGVDISVIAATSGLSIEEIKKL